MPNLTDIAIAETLLKGPADVWTLAPKAVVAKAEAAEKARRDHLDALDRVSDAEVALPVTQAQWESDGRAAVRAGKPLPSRDPLDRARFELDNAKADEQLTRNAEHAATFYVAETLADTATRD